MPQNKGKLRAVRVILWVLAALALVAAIVVWTFYDPETAGVPPADGSVGEQAGAPSIGGPFSLVTGDGETFTEADLVGRPHAIFFGFTRCPDLCPMALQRLARLRAEMNEAKAGSGDAFGIVFVSVDPESDSPEAVGEYVKLFGTPITGLAGDADAIAKIADAYKIYVSKRPLEGGDYTVDHSATIFLMDEKGAFAGTIDAQESDEVAREKLEKLVS